MTTQDKNTSCELQITPLSVHTGAEISGVDLCHPLTTDHVDQIRNALLKWRVVFFRGQELTHPQHISFAKRFGDPTPGHVILVVTATIPKFIPL